VTSLFCSRKIHTFFGKFFGFRGRPDGDIGSSTTYFLCFKLVRSK